VRPLAADIEAATVADLGQEDPVVVALDDLVELRV